MRHLSRKQKNALRRYVKAKWFDKGEEKPMFFNCDRDLIADAYWHIFTMHEFECFDSCVNNFVDDIKTLADCKII